MNKAVVRLIYFLFLFLLIEITGRFYFSHKYELPFFFNSEQFIGKHFYHIEDLQQKSIPKGDEKFDILLLGGSVLHPKWGNVPSRLNQVLVGKYGWDIQIHNVAVPAHTSLDSYYKYRMLRDKSFDLVLFYHGINEVRANNAPREIYRDDYGHYGWYRAINIFMKYIDREIFIAPKILRYLWFFIQDKYGWVKLVPMHDPHKDWIQYGGDIKSTDALDENLRKILDLANEKGEPVLLMTFAYYVPDDYSLTAFQKKELDYRNHGVKIEKWGKPEHIVAGLEAHNEVIEKVAADNQYADVLFVDLNEKIQKSGKYFDDICHLTNIGSAALVNEVMTALQYLDLEEMPFNE